MKKGISFFVFILIFSFSATAQENKYPYTLSDFLREALKHNQIILSAANQQSSVVFSALAVKEGYLPQFNIGSHLIVAPSRGYDPAITNGGEFGAQIGGSYLVYDGGSKELSIRKADIGVDQSKTLLNSTKSDVLYLVSTAFVEAQKQERELVVLQNNYNLLEEYLKLVNALHFSGQASESDILKTMVRVNNAKISMETQLTSLKNSLKNLAVYSGISVDKVTKVDTTFTIESADTTFLPDRNPEVQAGNLQLYSAKLQVALAKAQVKPTVSIGVDAGALTSLPNLQQGLSNVFGASAGIYVSMPIITLGAIENRVKSEEAITRSVEAQNHFLVINLEKEFEVARNEYLRSVDKLKALRKNLVVALKNLSLSQARYAGGNGSSLEVLDAIQLVNDVRMSIEETQADLQLSLAAMKRLNNSWSLSQ
ncbi:MAG: TolC family protein [Candidatus Kryptoniota bacterium]